VLAGGARGARVGAGSVLVLVGHARAAHGALSGVASVAHAARGPGLRVLVVRACGAVLRPGQRLVRSRRAWHAEGQPVAARGPGVAGACRRIRGPCARGRLPGHAAGARSGRIRRLVFAPGAGEARSPAVGAGRPSVASARGVRDGTDCGGGLAGGTGGALHGTRGRCVLAVP